jgi:acid phosphatase type 7
VLALRPAILALVPAVAWAAPFQKGPYLQNVQPDGVTVMWQATPPTAGRVRVKVGQTEKVIESPERGIHEVTIAGLTPGQRYVYTVECGGETSGGEFATAPGPAEPFTFVVYGDTRSQHDPHRTLVERIRREVPDFILLTGDMVDEGHKEDDWQKFFDIERELLRENVMYPAVGNHDRQGRARTADAFRRYFSVPADTPDPERYYAFTYGNSRFLILDSNEHSFALTDQTAWLEQELADAAADPRIQHRFVVMHHPVFSTSLHGGHAELREMWVPMFERYGVEAVFSGHDHTYEHAESRGVRYFVSGGGGAPLYPRDVRSSKADLAASIYFERTFNYLRIQVVGDRIEVTSMREDGSRIETLSWGDHPAIAHAAPQARTMPVMTATVLPAPALPSAGCAVGGGAGDLGLGLGLLVSVLCARARRGRGDLRARGRRRRGATDPRPRA